MKNGIRYFPVESSIRIEYELIKARFGLAGYAIIDLIIHKIYDDEGYFCKWDEDRVYLFASSNGVASEFVAEVVADAVSRGIFDKRLYETYQILTSVEIQKNFIEATKRRKNIEVIEEYFVVPHGLKKRNADNLTANADISSKNADSFQQKRREERRIDEKRTEEKRTEEKQTGEKKCAQVSAEADEASASEKKVPFGTTAHSEKETFDFGRLISDFNRVCTKLAPVQQMSKRRKEAVLKTYQLVKDIGGFEKLFKRVSDSEFLCGKNDRGWVCTFDWVINPDNALKVMEGQYANKEQKKGSFDTEDFFAAALKRSYRENSTLHTACGV